MWSERDGSVLKWGNADKNKSERFQAGSIIIDVLPHYHKMIREARRQPEEFCMVEEPGGSGGPIVARALIPEIYACIAHAQAEKDTQGKAWKDDFDAARASGEAFRSAEIADQYGGELVWARRLREKEKAGYADWFKDVGMVSFSASPRIKVNRGAIRRVVGSRKPNGQFYGCSNHAWAITEQEWEQIVTLSAEMSARKTQAREVFEAAEAADIQHKIDAGYCFHCESYCHGDCGHYSTNPMAKFRRALEESTKEQNYGMGMD